MQILVSFFFSKPFLKLRRRKGCNQVGGLCFGLVVFSSVCWGCAKKKKKLPASKPSLCKWLWMTLDAPRHTLPLFDKICDSGGMVIGRYHRFSLGKLVPVPVCVCGVYAVTFLIGIKVPTLYDKHKRPHQSHVGMTEDSFPGFRGICIWTDQPTNQPTQPEA